MSETTEICADARWELLRALAMWRDHERRTPDPLGLAPSAVPLFGACDWQHGRETMRLAVKECAALGEIEVLDDDDPMLRAVYGCFLRITDKGYTAVAVHDATQPDPDPDAESPR